ncbi:PLDc_N domain-containing protein [Candidatus Woesearchaeota archaeon]|nr:PLDc_N domain-containing protein [Candidatus Woesearchaeota archaeon]
MGELAAMLGLFGLLGLFWIIIIGALIALFIFWVMMIVDVAQRKFPEPNQQLIWILVVVLAGYIGAIIYYFVIKRKDQLKNTTRKSRRK